MTWVYRDCPGCGQSPVRWDPSRKPVPLTLQDAMDEPQPFRCDGCGETWVSDVADDDSGFAENATEEAV